MEKVHLHFVFVYGTLRRNESNHSVLGGAKCVAENAWINASLYDTGFGYPAVILSGSDRVKGEIYEVDDRQLAEVDLLEGYKGPGHENLYDRVTLPVRIDGGVVEVEAFVYTVDHNLSICQDKINNGDWVNRVGVK